MNYSGSLFKFGNIKAHRTVFVPTIGRGMWNTPNPAYIGKVICTYAIHCEVTGQAYVGSTEDFWYRWKSHNAALKRGLHKNVLLQEAYDKHGSEAFSIRILQEYESTSGLLKAEAEDALKFYDEADLLNGRIGMLYLANYPIGSGRPRKPTARPGSQTKSRWYTGEATL